MRIKRVPETNPFGLVLPPSHEDLKYLKLFKKPKQKPDGVDRHHLYWPGKVYESSKLAKQFREHRFNHIWILRSDHDRLHWRYDGVPIPPRDVMLTFLDEARLLDSLDVHAGAITMMDLQLYMGRVKKLEAFNERRLGRISTITETIKQVDRFEVVPRQVAQIAIAQLGELAVAA